MCLIYMLTDWDRSLSIAVLKPLKYMAIRYNVKMIPVLENLP